MSEKIDRRSWLTAAGTTTALAASLWNNSAKADEVSKKNAADQTATDKTSAATSENPFTLCFNTSCIMGQKVPLPEIVDLTAKAGYTAIEPWIREIEAYVAAGGSLADLRKRIADAGLKVESAIGFAQWIVDDEAARAKGLEQAKHDMDLVKQLGGTRIAAPPVGATQGAKVDLAKAAERYRELLKVGDSIGIIPQAEVWGFSANLSRLGETVYVAVEAQHPRSCILPDVYHLFKGGSEFEGLRLLSPLAVQVLHINDYPGKIAREKISDADRVYPGDGIAPLGTILRDLRAAGFRGVLSLELFNREYWKQDPALVAKTGYEKTKAAIEKAMG